MPSEAAARSFVRTAMSRRPVRERRRLATSRASSTKATRLTAAQAWGWLNGVDLHPEELHRADPGAAVEGVAQVVGVGEDHLRHEEPEAEGDHREVHARGSAGRGRRRPGPPGSSAGRRGRSPARRGGRRARSGRRSGRRCRRGPTGRARSARRSRSAPRSRGPSRRWPARCRWPGPTTRPSPRRAGRARSPTPSRSPGTLISPVPSRGSRSAMCERRGSPRPRTTTTRKITRNAGMRLSPVMRSWWKKSVMSPP